ncbi:putative chromatin regulator PHD family [Helianthus annuus]|uniref:RING-type E3 ubiquitin transferase n=1 Tax=Helianthus annuus TaxID=4232 RepID=A0A251SNY1_HELAN|nr:E3 ubiquitin-protein ligase ATL41 [Helianthus annuus]KAF5756425.1 putative chromatin regulator PHD family [Helianthus annuus]KAJ0429937.1 putative chromatin regulator PHD family [Helianthus annuus]KAJ0434669.1 putative chromatin regulator PHD family [Helianthus annuus]KAJ0448377.1 putative chromatin regulator PHD family [Helianthus annuus]KAJ0637071.1 putative chromatin regulator PHD family [Helianthus annuus]
MSGSKDGNDDDNEAVTMYPNSTSVNSRILFIAIIVLSTVVVLVTMLHIYTRYILRRQARRRVALQGIGLIARIHSDEPPRRGLEPDVISSIPILMYKNIGHGQESQDNECAVCLSSFEDGQMIRALPNCKHHFHAECIDKWLGSQTSCPICRHEVELGPTLLPLPREPSTRLADGVSAPSAPPLEPTSFVGVAKEGTSDGMAQSSSKVTGTSSRLGSFRRMISMDRSSRRNNSCTQDGIEDLERQ